MTVALGIASCMIMGAIGFSSIMRERESRSAGWPPGCRFVFLCGQFSTAGAATAENSTRVSRDSWQHLSARDSSPVGHDSTPVACMKCAPSWSLSNYS